MVEPKEPNWTLMRLIMWIVIGIAFSVYMVKFNTTEPTVETNSYVPSPPPNRPGDGYWEWDSYSQKWVFKYFSSQRTKSHRAKANYKSSEYDDEIQEYLEDHIEGYREDTYWGEEPGNE